jgi:hypothetical protein
VDRGYVRPEDEPPVVEPEVGQDGQASGEKETSGPVQRAAITVAVASTEPTEEDEDDAARPLPERVIIELTAHRTLALRDALAERPSIAFLAVLHNFALTTFYRFTSSGSLTLSSLQIGPLSRRRWREKRTLEIDAIRHSRARRQSALAGPYRPRQRSAGDRIP